MIDTPACELQLWEAEEGLEEAFEDIVELETQCRFSDCGHDSEPGCAIRAALDDGRLSGTVESFRKLERELEHLERRLDKRGERGTSALRAISLEVRRSGRTRRR